MKSVFILPNDLVEVYLPEDPENVISIRRKMDIKTNAAVQDELMRVKLNLEDGGDDGAGTQATVAIMQQELALLTHNVKAWRGDRFMIPRTDKNGKVVMRGDEVDMIPIPCTREWIGRIDPDDPLLILTLNKIKELNQPKRVKVDGGDGGDPLS